MWFPLASYMNPGTDDVQIDPTLLSPLAIPTNADDP
jgi:hypothetical protein